MRFTPVKRLDESEIATHGKLKNQPFLPVDRSIHPDLAYSYRSPKNLTGQRWKPSAFVARARTI